MRYTITTRSHTDTVGHVHPPYPTRWWVSEVRNEWGETVYETPASQDKASAIADAQDWLAGVRSY